MSQAVTQQGDVFARLAAPFPESEIRTRDGGGGRMLRYITARTALDRFDAAVGPGNWRNRTRVINLPNGDDAVVCTIEVKVDGEWVGKEDAGGFREMTTTVKGQVVHDAENTVKTGWSDAIKRAAVLWGVGRHLYDDDAGPGEARPGGGYQQAPAPGAPQNGHGGQPRPAYTGPQRAPTSGKALFAWTKEMEQKHEVGLLKYLNEWSKLQDFPGRMIDWDQNQVGLAYAEATRKLGAAAAAPAQPAAPSPTPARATVPATDRGEAYEGDEDIPF